MKCKKNIELLSLYVAEDLSPGDDKRLESHLSGCPECRKELALLQNSQTVIKKIREANIPELKWEEFWPGIRQQVLEHQPNFYHSLQLHVIRKRIAAAFMIPGLALLLIMGLLFLNKAGYFYRTNIANLRPSVSRPRYPEVKTKVNEINIWQDNKYPVINYLGNPDGGIMVFDTKDPLVKIVWIYDDAFNLSTSN